MVISGTSQSDDEFDDFEMFMTSAETIEREQQLAITRKRIHWEKQYQRYRKVLRQMCLEQCGGRMYRSCPLHAENPTIDRMIMEVVRDWIESQVENNKVTEVVNDIQPSSITSAEKKPLLVKTSPKCHSMLITNVMDRPSPHLEDSKSAGMPEEKKHVCSTDVKIETEPQPFTRRPLSTFSHF